MLRSPRTGVGEAGRRKGTPLSLDYIVGLTDGEGCFYVDVRKPYKGTRSIWLSTHFYIKVRQRDKHLLEMVKETLGCGRIYIQKDSRPNHDDCYRFDVGSREELARYILPLFDNNSLKSSKQKEFEWFREVIQIISRGEHFTQEGIKKISELKNLMSQHRGHRAR